MKICVVTDDNSGFTPEQAKELGIYMIRMPIIIDGVVYFQNNNITEDEFYDKLNKNFDVKTSQPSPGEVLNMWNKLLEEYDQIIHINMSSGLSESCHSAMMLSEDFKDKVFVVDNHRISVTLKRSIYDALNLINKGLDGAEIKKILEDTKGDSAIFIMVDTLKYLKKGGRITPAGAALGSTLHIKPVLSINGGKLDAYAKCLGAKKAKKTLIDAAEKALKTKFKDVNISDLEFAIAYTHNLEEAKEYATEVATYFNIPLDKILIDPLSLSVATHIGPGSLAIAISKIIK